MNPFYEQLVYYLQQHMMYNPTPDSPSITEAAINYDCQYEIMRRMIHGKIKPRLSDLPRLYHALGRPDAVLRHIVRSCDPGKDIIDINNMTALNGSMTDEILDINILLGTLVEKIRLALENDNRIDLTENDMIRNLAMEIVTVLFRLIRESEGKAAESRGITAK